MSTHLLLLLGLLVLIVCSPNAMFCSVVFGIPFLSFRKLLHIAVFLYFFIESIATSSRPFWRSCTIFLICLLNWKLLVWALVLIILPRLCKNQVEDFSFCICIFYQFFSFLSNNMKNNLVISSMLFGINAKLSIWIICIYKIHRYPIRSAFYRWPIRYIS